MELGKLANPTWREIGTLLQELDGIVRSGRPWEIEGGSWLRQVFPVQRRAL